MATIIDHDEPCLRAEFLDLLGERTFADVSDQYDPPDFAVFDEGPAAPGAVGWDEELCCLRCP